MRRVRRKTYSLLSYPAGLSFAPLPLGMENTKLKISHSGIQEKVAILFWIPDVIFEVL